MRVRVCMFVFLTAALASCVYVYMNVNAAPAFVVAERATVCMNTLMSISAELPKKTAEKIMSDAFLILSDLDDAFSRYKTSSDVSNVNMASGKEYVKVGRDTWSLLESSLLFSDATDGYFDPTVGPLTDLWRISSAGAWELPSGEQISAARKLVGFHEISLVSPNMVRLNLKGATLDFGAVAKGYAAEKVAKFLETHGASSALLDFGGDITLLGARVIESEAVPWRIGVRHPSLGIENAVCVLSFLLSPGEILSFVTSGSYEKFREFDGKKLSPVFDPHTGQPVYTNLVSVSVADPMPTRADALATAFLAMGEGRARKTLSRFPGTEAVFVHLEDGETKVNATEGLRGKIRLVDESAVLEIF